MDDISCPACAKQIHSWGTALTLLQLALKAIRDDLSLANLDDLLRTEIRHKAAGLLARPNAIDRRMSSMCSSSLWDYMPQALSLVSGAPLRIYSGDVRSGQVNLTVVDEMEEPNRPTGKLIRLMRTCHELHLCALRSGSQ